MTGIYKTKLRYFEIIISALICNSFSSISASFILNFGRYESKDNTSITIYEISNASVLLEDRESINVCKLLESTSQIKCYQTHQHKSRKHYHFKKHGNSHVIYETINTNTVKYIYESPVCSTENDSLFRGSWTYIDKIYSKTELFSYCPIFRESWGPDLQNGGNRNSYDCDGYRFVEFRGRNGCVVMTVNAALMKAKLLRSFKLIKRGVQLVGDSLSFINNDAFICELEHWNQTTALKPELTWTNYIIPKPICSDYCADPTSNEEHFKDHCPNCMNMSIPSQADTSKWFDGITAETNAETSAMIIGTGAWWNHYHGIRPSEKPYLIMLKALGAAMQNYAKEKQIELFWQHLPPMTTTQIKGRENYGWGHYTTTNKLASEILPTFGFHILATEHIYYPRKEKDPNVSQDGVHMCGPGPQSLNTMSVRLFLHYWMNLDKWKAKLHEELGRHSEEQLKQLNFAIHQ